VTAPPSGARLVDLGAHGAEVEFSLAYATPANFTGAVVYRRPLCLLHADAAACLRKAATLAASLGYRLKILDAFRPCEAQWVLWRHTPDPEYVADPRQGSAHSRGVAVDLTLLGAEGDELDMGTPFDSFTPLSHHGRQEGIGAAAQRNRLLLLGLMTAAGWDFYANEWWHYQLFDVRSYPLLSDKDLVERMMD
jgi:D-alanyl-D-alanine dipeptidase